MIDSYGNGTHSALAINHGALGDVVLAQAFAELFTRCPYVDKVLIDQRAPIAKLAPTTEVLHK